MKKIAHLNEQPIDPRLNELLGALRPTPPRRPESVSRGKARYLAEVDALLGTTTSRKMRTSRPGFTSTRERLSRLFAQSAWLRVVAMLVVAVVVLFGSAGATAFASQSSIPGEALYSFKTGLEKTRLELDGNPAHQAEMYLDFAENRLDEIAGLIQQGHFEEVSQVTTSYQIAIQQALNSVQVAAQQDASLAASLREKISQSLQRFNEMLDDILGEVPDDVQPAVQGAIDATTLRQVELDESQDSNENLNRNSDENGENGNPVNENETINQNGGSVQNSDQQEQNENGSTGGNENENRNQNTNENSDKNENDK